MSALHYFTQYAGCFRKILYNFKVMFSAYKQGQSALYTRALEHFVYELYPTLFRKKDKKKCVYIKFYLEITPLKTKNYEKYS